MGMGWVVLMARVYTRAAGRRARGRRKEIMARAAAAACNVKPSGTPTKKQQCYMRFAMYHSLAFVMGA